MPTLIEIVPYGPEWPVHFAVCERWLRDQLGDRVVAVEHIGSSAIPGMAAKPVLDIDVTLRTLADVRAASASLIDAGYEARCNRYDDEVWAFMLHAAAPKQRVDLSTDGNRTHARRILFRDFLRSHTGVALEYAHLKQRLAAAHPYDDDRYTAGKTAFIDYIVRQAHALQSEYERHR